MKNSGLDVLEELAKSITKAGEKDSKEEGMLQNLMNHHRTEMHSVHKSQPRRLHSMIKAAGPGGIQFDFGMMTGNPIADNATRMLNQFADSTQASISSMQQQEIGQAFMDYIAKGDRAFVPQGAIPDAWTKQLSGSTDEAIKAMHERGELDCSEDGSMKSVGPAFRNRFNESQITMGGELVKATSETDAALIEMMKHQGMDDGNTEECIDEYS
jgi:hypothetical protein